MQATTLDLGMENILKTPYQKIPILLKFLAYQNFWYGMITVPKILVRYRYTNFENFEIQYRKYFGIIQHFGIYRTISLSNYLISI